MTDMGQAGSRWLYLARHAEPVPDGSALTDVGEQQAAHLGRRLADLPVDRIVHGPLPRAARTARTVAEQFREPPRLQVVDAAGDYVPSVPGHRDVPERWADAVGSSFADVTGAEATEGRQRAAEAIDLLAGPGGADRGRVDVVITHAFTVGWLVRHALDAPDWRWWGLDLAHAGLTAIRYDADRPPAVVVLNDLTHLPTDLRWTGFPDHRRP